MASSKNNRDLFNEAGNQRAHCSVHSSADGKNSSFPKWNSENYYSLPGHFYPKPPAQPQKRAIVQDGQKGFKIVVDVHDFSPQEISVQIVERGSAIIVKGEHISGKAEDEYFGHGVGAELGETRSESRSFCERYSLPNTVDANTGKWELSKDNSQLIFTAAKKPPRPKINPAMKHNTVPAPKPPKAPSNSYSYLYKKNPFKGQQFNTNKNVVDYVDETALPKVNSTHTYGSYPYYPRPQPSQQFNNYMRQYSY